MKVSATRKPDVGMHRRVSGSDNNEKTQKNMKIVKEETFIVSD